MGKIEIPKYKGKLEGKDLDNFIEKHSKYWEGIDSVEYQRNLRDGVEKSDSNCNLQNVSVNEVAVCHRCKSDKIDNDGFEAWCTECNAVVGQTAR